MRKGIGEALIFVEPINAKLSLEEFAKEVFNRLRIPRWQGYSGNQSDEVVFGGDAAGIVVAVGNEGGDGRYSFGVTLSPKVRLDDTDYLVEHARNLAKHWSHHGWRCFVPRDGLYEITSYEDGTRYEA
jgi:hypothetical protein